MTDSRVETGMSLAQKEGLNVDPEISSPPFEGLTNISSGFAGGDLALSYFLSCKNL